MFATAGIPEDFLAVLYDSFEEETTAFLGFDEQQCVLPVGRELEVLLAVHLETEGIWQSPWGGGQAGGRQDRAQETGHAFLGHSEIGRFF